MVIEGLNVDYLSHGPTHDWGAGQRSFALEYVLKQPWGNGVVYFADDDNRFDVEIYAELAKVRRIGIMPVGNLGPHGIEGPIVRNNKIIGWDADWRERKFPTDVAGFAVHTDLIRERLGASPSYPAKYGGETEFLQALGLEMDDLEPLCCDCTKCYAWHNEPHEAAL